MSHVSRFTYKGWCVHAKRVGKDGRYHAIARKADRPLLISEPIRGDGALAKSERRIQKIIDSYEQSLAAKAKERACPA